MSRVQGDGGESERAPGAEKGTAQRGQGCALPVRGRKEGSDCTVQDGKWPQGSVKPALRARCVRRAA